MIEKVCLPILLALFVVFPVTFAAADDSFDQSDSDIYYEMTSKIDDLPDDGSDSMKNEQIRLTGDKYGLTDQEARDLYQEGRSEELEDE